jgi:hypothetical protein
VKLIALSDVENGASIVFRDFVQTHMSSARHVKLRRNANPRRTL